MEQEYRKRGRKASTTEGLGQAGPRQIQSGAGPVSDKLEEIVREGARRLLAEMLEAEVDEFLQRVRYERGWPPCRVYGGSQVQGTYIKLHRGWPPCIRGFVAIATGMPRGAR